MTNVESRVPTVATAAAWCRRAALVVVLFCAFGPRPARAESSVDPAPPRAAGEALVEGRLLAPCCWTQTLDTHESELATELRAEVRARLHAGERPEAIEDSLVARYGERIRAVPKGRDSREAIPLVVGLGMALAAAALVVALRRWLRDRPAAAAGAPAPVDAGTAADDPYDAKLDEELRRLEG